MLLFSTRASTEMESFVDMISVLRLY
jgi:hypothetical protein